jgi:hypothetical protein
MIHMYMKPCVQHFGLTTHFFVTFDIIIQKLYRLTYLYVCVFGFINGANVYLKHN